METYELIKFEFTATLNYYGFQRGYRSLNAAVKIYTRYNLLRSFITSCSS
jgi:hypothetical protein